MGGKAVSILVVDDDEALCNVVSETLREDGHAVDTASSAEEALRVFRAKPYQLVISDIRMSGMSGIELLKKLKERNADTQVVIMTSYASLETVIAAMRSGAYDYLIKPFEDLGLISAVADRALEKIRLVAENRELVDRLKKHAGRARADERDPAAARDARRSDRPLQPEVLSRGPRGRARALQGAPADLLDGPVRDRRLRRVREDAGAVLRRRGPRTALRAS